MKKMISRRNFLTTAGVVAAAGVLTACGGSSSSTAASSTAASAAGSAAASGDTIKIGVMGPLTGNVSVYGQAVVNGATLYLKQVNADGGVNGKQLEIITMDEQGDATQAVTCFTKMCDQGITALVGDVTTTPTLAVAAESADYNMPMVTASAPAAPVYVPCGHIYRHICGQRQIPCVHLPQALKGAVLFRPPCARDIHSPSARYLRHTLGR